MLKAYIKKLDQIRIEGVHKNYITVEEAEKIRKIADRIAETEGKKK